MKFVKAIKANTKIIVQFRKSASASWGLHPPDPLLGRGFAPGLPWGLPSLRPFALPS